MTTLNNIPIRNYKEISSNNKTFFSCNPTEYKYVREGNSLASHPSYKPIKKRDKNLKLIGLDEPKKISFRVWEIRFWYLKSYDLGMPDEKERKEKGTGYYYWGKNADGTLIKNENPTIVPCEAVKFIK